MHTVNNKAQSNVNSPQVATGWRFCTCKDNWASYFKEKKPLNYVHFHSEIRFSYRCRNIKVVTTIYNIMRQSESSFSLMNIMKKGSFIITYDCLDLQPISVTWGEPWVKNLKPKGFLLWG